MNFSFVGLTYILGRTYFFSGRVSDFFNQKETSKKISSIQSLQLADLLEAIGEAAPQLTPKLFGIPGRELALTFQVTGSEDGFKPGEVWDGFRMEGDRIKKNRTVKKS